MLFIYLPASATGAHIQFLLTNYHNEENISTL